MLTLVLTWPLAQRLRIMDPGDSAFFAWVMAFERHALLTEPWSLPHGNAGHPARFVLGLDEPVLTTTLLGLPLWPFTADAVLLYSLVRLLTFWCSALAAWRLGRELGLPEAPALLVGALFAFSPIRTDQIAHLSTLGTQYLPLVALYLVRLARRGGWSPALLAGSSYALAFYACGYHGVLGVAVWPALALVLLWKRAGRLPAAMGGLLLAGALLWPLHALHAAALLPHAFERDTAEALQYSAGLESLLAVSPWNRVWGQTLSVFRGSANDLFPGVVPLLIIAAAAWVRWRGRTLPRRETLAFVALALVAVLVALGPEIRVGERVLATSPVAVLRELFGPFASLRAYGRAGIYLALALAVLAGLAAQALRLRPAFVALLGAAALAEGAIVPIPLASWAQVIDTAQPAPPVYAWLAAQPPGQPVVELPMLELDSLTRRPAFHDSIYMVRSTLHWQPLVNGYFGFESPAYQSLRISLRRFPEPEALQALRQIGVRYAVVHRRGYGPNQWQRLAPALETSSGARRVADFGDDVVYEIKP